MDRIWQNLTENKCPKCGLRLHNDGERLICSTSCGFTIRVEKAQEVSTHLVAKQQRVTNVEKILPNGKLKFKAAKTFKGERPAEPFQFGY